MQLKDDFIALCDSSALFMEMDEFQRKATEKAYETLHAGKTEKVVMKEGFLGPFGRKTMQRHPFHGFGYIRTWATCA